MVLYNKLNGGNEEETPKTGSCWQIAKLVLQVIEVLAAIWLVLALYYVILKTNEVQDPVMCYQCTSMISKADDDAGVPYEQECEASPKFLRICQEGEMCANMKMWMGNATRFERSCFPSKIAGCVTRLKPNKATFCFCKAKRCL